MRLLETDTLADQDISTALAAGAYTADAARMLYCRLALDQIAGDGDYTAYLTIQRGGAGSSYRVVPITTAAVASGVTAAMLVTVAIPVSSGDVVTAYVLGLAGDTTTVDTICEWWEDDALRPETADRTIEVDADGKVALPAAYDAAKTAAQPGDQMDLVNAPNATAVAAIQSGLAATVEAAAATAGLAVEANVEGHAADALATYGAATAGDIPVPDDVAAAVWNFLVAAAMLDGSMGKLVADMLDAAMSSRLAAGDYVAPLAAASDQAEHDATQAAIAALGFPAIADIVDAVWKAVAASYTNPAWMGGKLNAAGAAADPLLNAVPGTYASGTAGAALGKIGANTINTIAPIAAGGAITIVQGDDYNNADGRAIDWIEDAGDTAWPDLTGATISVAAGTKTFAGSVVVPTGDAQQVRLELTAAQSATLSAGIYTYQVEATLSSGRVVTLATGTLTVVRDIA